MLGKSSQLGQRRHDGRVQDGTTQLLQHVYVLRSHLLPDVVALAIRCLMWSHWPAATRRLWHHQP